MPDRLILFTAAGALLVNFILNTQFYPQLGKYQSGNTMAAQIRDSKARSFICVHLWYGGQDL